MLFSVVAPTTSNVPPNKVALVPVTVSVLRSVVAPVMSNVLLPVIAPPTYNVLVAEVAPVTFNVLFNVVAPVTSNVLEKLPLVAVIAANVVAPCTSNVPLIKVLPVRASTVNLPVLDPTLKLPTDVNVPPMLALLVTSNASPEPVNDNFPPIVAALSTVSAVPAPVIFAKANVPVLPVILSTPSKLAPLT